MDLKSFVNLIGRRLWLLVGITVVIAVAITAVSFVITPQYSATAHIKVDPAAKQLLDKNQSYNMPADASIIDTEIAIMRSPAVAEAVVKALDLTKDPEFGDHEDPSQALLETTEALLEKVDISRSGATYIIDLSVRSVSAEKAQRLANAMARAYVATSRQSEVATAATQAKSLNEQLAAIGNDVRAADANVANYRGATGIASGSGSLGTVTDQQISTIAGQLGTAESDAAAARSRANAAQSQIASRGVEAVSEVLNAPVIADLRRQRTEVVREQAQISANYGPLHPESIRIQQSLRDIDSQLQAESQRIVSGLQSDARAAEARAAALRGQLGGLRGQLNYNAKASVQADALSRDAEAKREIYNSLAQTAQQTSQQEQLGQARGQIVGDAVLPLSPSFPNHPLFAMLGLVVGAAFGSATILGLELFDSRVRSISDVENVLRLPFISAVPLLSPKQLKKGQYPADFIMAKPVSGYAETIRVIRAALISGERTAAGGGVYAVTSAVPGEGKSSVSSSLGRIAAMSGDRVLLVDCDLRRGTLKGLNDTAPEQGLVEVLKGEADWKSVLVKDKQAGLDILTATGRTFATEDFVSSPAMAALLVDLRKHYDTIIIDAAPVLAVAETRRLAMLVDKTVMVVRWNATKREAVQAALTSLEDVGVKPIGIVLTAVDTTAKNAVGADNPAYYYDSYKGYYQD